MRSGSRPGRTPSSTRTSEERAYVALAVRGELTGRVVGAMWWEHHRGAEQIEEFVERRRATSIGRYRPTSVKLMMDGVLENFTGAMLEPYGDGHGGMTDNRGLIQIDPEGLTTWVPQLDALGFQPHFHAIGDRAVRESLDAVEAARQANGPSDTRPHIAHIQVIHPDDIGSLPGARRRRQRPAAVGRPRRPDGRAHDPVHRRTLALAVPVPLAPRGRRRPGDGLGLERVHARTRSGRWRSPSSGSRDRVAGREVFLPEERLELIDALAAFTMGSAYVNHLDRETGTLEVGKLADLAVLDRDLFDRGAGAIGEARVVATFVEGVAVRGPELDG